MTSLVVITPERDHPREHAVLEALFALGLERCHVRKPHASVDELRAWIAHVAPEVRLRLVLHQHHELVDEFGLGGRHWRDADAGAVGRGPRSAPSQSARRVPGRFSSRSCHDFDTLRASLGQFDSVFLSPVFASVSKPGYGPSAEQPRGEGIVGPHSGRTNVEHRTSNIQHPTTDPISGVPVVGGVPSPRLLSDFLRNRIPSKRTTTVLALGGITADTAPRALALGFDGVAVLGAVWQASDPVAAYVRIRDALAAAAQPARAPRPAQHPASVSDPECHPMGYTVPPLPRGGGRVV